MFGAFAYVGADLHLRFGLSFTLVGTVRRRLRDRRPDLQPVGAACWSTGSARSGSPPVGGMLLALAYRGAGVRRRMAGIAPLRHHRHRASASTCCTTRCRPTPRRCAGSARHRGRRSSRPRSISGRRSASRSTRRSFDRSRRGAGVSDRGGGLLRSAVVRALLRQRRTQRLHKTGAHERRLSRGRARRARSRRARCARPCPADCRRARTSASAAASPAPDLRACARSAPARYGRAN